jgi:hypothetical protein
MTVIALFGRAGEMDVTSMGMMAEWTESDVSEGSGQQHSSKELEIDNGQRHLGDDMKTSLANAAVDGDEANGLLSLNWKQKARGRRRLGWREGLFVHRSGVVGSQESWGWSTCQGLGCSD